MENDRLVQIEAEQLLTLQQNPKVSKEALERAFELAFPEPTPSQWQSFLLRVFYSLGGGLFVCGLFFLVDHFWADMTYGMRTGFFALSTSVCALAAWRRGRHSIAGKVALACTSVLIGGLLLVAGGSIASEHLHLLLLAWSALILPLCIAAEFAPLWLFGTGLFNVTLRALCMEYGTAWFFQHHYYEIAILGLNVTLLATWEIGFRQGRSWMGRRWFPPILTLAGLTPMTLTACALVVGGRFSELMYPLGLTLVITWAAFLSYFSGIRRDVSVLSLTLASTIFLGTSVLWTLVFRSGDYLSLFILSAGIAVQISAALGLLRKLAPPLSVVSPATAQDSTDIKVWLGQLATEGLIETKQLEELGKAIQVQHESALPWFVRGLAGFGAFWSSVFLLLYLIVSEVVTTENGLIFGLGLCVFACIGARVKSDFLQQTALSLSFCGQLLVWLIQLANHTEIATIDLSMVGLELALVLYYPSTFGRFLSANAAGLFFAHWLALVAPQPALDILVALVASLATLLWLRQPTIFSGPLGRVHGPIAMASVSLLFLLLVTTLSQSSGWPQVGILATAALTALAIYSAKFIGAPRRTLIGLGAVGAISCNAPGVMAAVLALLLGFFRRNQTLKGLAIIFLLAFGTAFYYHLAYSLLVKSVILMASGLAFGLTARSLESYRPSDRDSDAQ